MRTLPWMRKLDFSEMVYQYLSNALWRDVSTLVMATELTEKEVRDALAELVAEGRAERGFVKEVFKRKTDKGGTGKTSPEIPSAVSTGDTVYCFTRVT